MADSGTRSLRAVIGRAAADVREKFPALKSGELSFAAVALVVVFGSLLGIVVLLSLIHI